MNVHSQTYMPFQKLHAMNFLPGGFISLPILSLIATPSPFQHPQGARPLGNDHVTYGVCNCRLTTLCEGSVAESLVLRKQPRHFSSQYRSRISWGQGLKAIHKPVSGNVVKRSFISFRLMLGAHIEAIVMD
ncbi:hypothetical protein KP05_04665 [Cobetia amphilecti]|nr:hypothetical protein KP05_04665 [Cobetia amphilecti]